jgi:hypothetical protein
MKFTFNILNIERHYGDARGYAKSLGIRPDKLEDYLRVGFVTEEDTVVYRHAVDHLEQRLIQPAPKYEHTRTLLYHTKCAELSVMEIMYATGKSYKAVIKHLVTHRITCRTYCGKRQIYIGDPVLQITNADFRGKSLMEIGKKYGIPSLYKISKEREYRKIKPGSNYMTIDMVQVSRDLPLESMTAGEIALSLGRAKTTVIEALNRAKINYRRESNFKQHCLIFEDYSNEKLYNTTFKEVRAAGLNAKAFTAVRKKRSIYRGTGERNTTYKDSKCYKNNMNLT